MSLLQHAWPLCSPAIAQCQALDPWAQAKAERSGAGGRTEGFRLEVRGQRTGKGYVLWEQASVPGMELAPVPWLSQVAWGRGPVPWDPRSHGQGHTGDEFGAGEVCCPVWGTQQQLCR